MKHLNVEIKARARDHARVRKILTDKKADYRGTDHQVDTYFVVPKGRLKLREGSIENHLIHYKRENTHGPKQSNVTLYDTAPGASLKQILVDALGVLAVVDKEREIYFMDNVKFHIDTVKDLGTFVEIEAIDDSGEIGLEKLREQCDQYVNLLGIVPEDFLAHSYSDMVLERAGV